MSSVDNRVVHMTFDNAKFERDIAKTMESIAKLKQALDFSKAKQSIADLGDLSKFKMSIDTSALTRSLSETERSIKKVQDSLNFGAASRSIGHLTESVKGFSLDNMSSAVTGVGAKFSALSVIAITTLATIVSRAVSAGIDITKAFTVSPIIEGFQEMETNMNSIQTILANTASKGSTLDDVNDALQQLNEYSDKTIYNFSQMARNIGTFTAAGVDLDTSVGAIKGIANLAAISGSNSEQASSAMYQLSQALATGTLKLIDWNSVVNAGMGGEVFKNALFETGKALGTIADVPIDQSLKAWEDAGNNFRDSLQDGWITSEVLTTTLQSFTGDLSAAQLTSLGYTEEQAKEMEKLGKLGNAAATEVKTLTQLLGTVKEAVGSGWSRSFQLIFGDFEEAKATFTDFNNIIGGFIQKNADARNEVIADWKKMGGRTALIYGIKNAFVALNDILEPIKEAFRELFPPITGERLAELTKKFQQFTGDLRLHGGQMWKIREIFRGVFATISIGIEIVKEVIEVFSDLFTNFREQNGSSILDFFLDLSGTIQELKTRLVDEGGLSDFFDNLTEKLLNPVDSLRELRDNFLGFFQDIDFGSLDGLVEAFQRIKEKVEEFFDTLGFDFELPKGLTDFFQRFFDNVSENTSNSIDLAGGFDRIAGALDFLKGIAEGVWDALTKVDDVLGFLWDKFNSLKDIGLNVLEKMWEFAKDIGNALSTGLKSEELQSVLDILDSIALLMGGRGLQQLASNGLGVNLAADLTGGNLPKIGGAFDQLGGTFAAFKRNLDTLSSTLQTMQTQIKANALLDIAKALALLAGSVLVLSFIDPASLGKSMTALAVGMGQLLGAVALLTLSTKGIGIAGSVHLAGIATSMILVAGAMVVLSGAVKILSTIPVEQLATGMLALTGMLTSMVVVAQQLQGSSGALIAGGIGMIAISTAMIIMSGALKVFATMSWEEIGKGMTALVGSLLAVAGAVNLMPVSILLIGPGLIAVATAVSILGGALLILSSMSWEEIGKGMVALGGGLLIIAGAMSLMPLTTVLNGPALIAVATAMTILSGALKVFATMSWEEIGKAMAALGGSLLILAGGLTLMQGAIPGAIALGIASVSLGIFSAVLKEFAKIKWKDLGRGLAVMATALGAIALASLLLQPTVPAILALSVALIALGAGFALIGLGAGLLAEAFKVIADAGTASIDTFMYGLDALLQRIPELVTVFLDTVLAIVQQLLDALPAIIVATGKIIQALFDVIIDAIPGAIRVVIEFIEGILRAIRETFPDWVETGFSMLMALLRGIDDNIADITATVASIIENFLTELAGHIPELVTAGVDVLEAFIRGIADNVDDIAGAIGDLVTAFIEEVAELYGRIFDAGADALIAFLDGLLDDTTRIVRAAGNLIAGVLAALASEAVRLANRMAKVLTAFLNGLAEAVRTHGPEIEDAAYDLAEALVLGIIDFFISERGVELLWSAGKRIVENIYDSIIFWSDSNSPSRLFMELGEYMVDGVAVGLGRTASAEAGAKYAVERTYGAFNKALQQADFVLQSMDEFNPVITPVLDLTKVTATAGQISGLLGAPTLTTDANLQAANTLSAETNRTREEATTDAQQTYVREVKFEQINNSPQALNTATIYRQTRNLIELTKKDLEVA